MRPEDYAWAAGLFEGEGSLSWIRKELAPYPTAKLSMTDEDVVQRFAAIIGVGKVTRPKRIEGRKQLYSWRAFGAAAMERLNETIGPWLGVRRRAKLNEMLTYEPMRDEQGGRWKEPRRFTTEGMEALREVGRRRRRLEPDLVREIRRRADAGESHRGIARDLGVGKSTVGAIANRQAWGDLE